MAEQFLQLGALASRIGVLQARDLGKPHPSEEIENQALLLIVGRVPGRLG